MTKRSQPSNRGKTFWPSTANRPAVGSTLTWACRVSKKPTQARSASGGSGRRDLLSTGCTRYLVLSTRYDVQRINDRTHEDIEHDLLFLPLHFRFSSRRHASCLRTC